MERLNVILWSVKGKNEIGEVTSPVPAQNWAIVPWIQSERYKGYQAKAAAKHYKAKEF